MGTFFKQIYRYTHPRRYRHNENLWPYVKITRASEGYINSLSLRGKRVPIVNLSDLQKKYSGDLLIVASGPSVNETDFTPLQSLPAMGVNGSWFLSDKINFKFFVIVDMTFIDQRLSMIEEVISDPDLLFFTTVHGIVKIIDHFGQFAISCQVAIIEDACMKIFQPTVFNHEISLHWQHEKSVRLWKEDKSIAFNHDIRKGIFDAATVVYWSLQIIQFIGFNRVIIAGLDMNNFQQPRFYEKKDDISPCYLESQFTALIKPAFIHARNELESKEIEVLNLSLHSALDSSIFRKVNPNDV
ncbi:sugar glycosyltransferase [Candidatus Erwinia dacicola]|uniref:Putative lipopolysaccharide glycosyltransferase n=1 Tax=Candidatus Erwinia dacicola TaxID=252393 RepID=A0A1E7Z4N7_9GAMM|nr:sugar glycosyltransferase [Candidatus Erwinia dacicola]OFC63729.1 sugar glycosyltransferase [Candidatus Erwinia dacicola]RAP70420.1 putative lipopolysaccharide glycosyltransferase [Candidatus Erwinia dacicola]